MSFESIVGTKPILDLPLELDPEEFRALVRFHNSAETCRWWQAVIDPEYDPRSGTGETGAPMGGKYLYTEKPTINSRVLFRPARVMKRYFPTAEIESGDWAITFMPDELALSDHDLVAPMGHFQRPTLTPSMVAYTEKQSLVRGSVIQSLGVAATSSVSSIALSAVPAQALHVGDLVQAASLTTRITAVGSATSYGIDDNPSPAWNSVRLSKCVEMLTKDTAITLLDVRDENHVSYTPGVDVVIAPDAQTLQWLTLHSPAAGTTYSVVYTYAPKFLVREDMGMRRHRVQGRPLPETLLCKLWQPDTLIR